MSVKLLVNNKCQVQFKQIWFIIFPFSLQELQHDTKINLLIWKKKKNSADIIDWCWQQTSNLKYDVLTDITKFPMD